MESWPVEDVWDVKPELLDWKNDVDSVATESIRKNKGKETQKDEELNLSEEISGLTIEVLLPMPSKCSCDFKHRSCHPSHAVLVIADSINFHAVSLYSHSMYLSLKYPWLSQGGGKSDESYELTCPICIGQIEESELALVKGCEHAYCVSCILKWALYASKGEPCSEAVCPKCKSPFRAVLTTRCLNGELRDSLSEEPLSLLSRAVWLQVLMTKTIFRSGILYVWKGKLSFGCF